MLWRAHGEAEIQVLGRGHPAAVVAGEPDGQQAPLFCLGDRRHQVLGVAGCRQGDGDVTVAGVGDDLAREDQVEPDVVAQRGDHGLVGGQRPRRDGSAAARGG